MAKQDPTVAVGVAIPFAVAVQAGITLLFTFFSPLMHTADKYAEKCDIRGIDGINYLGMGILFVFYFTVVFLPISMGAEAAQGIVALLPPWLIKGFGVAGGMMPAIGFALLLNIMFKKEYIIFFALGFILATYLNLQVIAIAAIGFIIAVYDYQKSKSIAKMERVSLVSSTEEDYSDGI